jgi:hypothetical protein
MRIVTQKEFYDLPVDTLYSIYDPCIFNGLFIKKETIYSEDGEGIDFYYQDLIGNVKTNLSESILEILSKAELDGSRFRLDFRSIDRDGLFDQDALYAIYEKNEVKDLISCLDSCTW